ncbi:MAG TPA: Spx/MgsR family RNA polymerase-binding regulatory protein [Leptolyngbya sp.]|nr:Spx/MgsR family RNA polymerase-binding regulatory protein [Leptolyngbya sp.]
MSLQVYGIPTCGTCKKAFKWLENHAIAYDFINTKEHPPAAAQIQSWVTALGVKPMRNTSGQSYRAIAQEKQTWTDAQWVEAFAKDPMLLKRPLFVKNGQAVSVGFREDALQQSLEN